MLNCTFNTLVWKWFRISSVVSCSFCRVVDKLVVNWSSIICADYHCTQQLWFARLAIFLPWKWMQLLAFNLRVERSTLQNRGHSASPSLTVKSLVCQASTGLSLNAPRLARCKNPRLTGQYVDRPAYVGMCILDLSKTLMYDFYYNTIKRTYGDKAKLLFTDTDSLCYEIQTENVYKDIWGHKDLFDFSDYPKNSQFYDPTNKKYRVNSKMNAPESLWVISLVSEARCTHTC